VGREGYAKGGNDRWREVGQDAGTVPAGDKEFIPELVPFLYNIFVVSGLYPIIVDNNEE